MLPKEYRLPAYLIPQIIRYGTRFRSLNLNLIVLKSEKNIPSRFAFNVPVKFNKRATRRNLIKRRLREIVRKNLNRIKKGYNVLCQVIVSERRINFNQINFELGNLLQKAQLLENRFCNSFGGKTFIRPDGERKKSEKWTK